MTSSGRGATIACPMNRYPVKQVTLDAETKALHNLNRILERGYLRGPPAPEKSYLSLLGRSGYLSVYQVVLKVPVFRQSIHLA